MRPAHLAIVLGVMLPFAPALAQRPIALATNAPADKPIETKFDCEWRVMVQTLEPYVKAAQTTYPTAKKRFLAGLPENETFFVTVRLADTLDHHEQTFVAVDSISGDRIVGRIWNVIGSVQGYQLGQPYETDEREIVDWMFSKPDGSEEGNVVGKFLDTYRPARDCRDPGGER